MKKSGGKVPFDQNRFCSFLQSAILSADPESLLVLQWRPISEQEVGLRACEALLTVVGSAASAPHPRSPAGAQPALKYGEQHTQYQGSDFIF